MLLLDWATVAVEMYHMILMGENHAYAVHYIPGRFTDPLRIMSSIRLMTNI